MLDVTEATTVFAVLSHTRSRVPWYDDSTTQVCKPRSSDYGNYPDVSQWL